MDDVTPLIQDCLAGHKEAWDTFVKEYSRWIYHSVLGTARYYGHRMSSEDAGELTQDVFCCLLEKGLRRFQGRERPRLLAYVRRIAVCQTINFLKRIRKTVPMDEALNGLDFLGREMVQWSQAGRAMDNHELLQRLLKRLTGTERRLLDLYYFEGVPVVEIAGLMKISVEAYYVRKNRIIKKLRGWMQSLEESETQTG